MRRGIAIIVSLCFIFTGVMSLPVYAGEAAADLQEAQGLTIEQAVDLALQHSRSLDQIDLDIERSKEVRDQARDNIKFIPTGPGADIIASQAFTGLVAADISWQMAKKSRSVEEDTIVLSTIKAYMDILQAVQNLDYAKKAERNSYQKWLLAIASYEAGMISDSQHKLAGTQHKLAVQAVKAAELELANAYQSLNKLIGLDPSDRPVLQDRPQFNPADLDEPELMAHRALSGNPAIWQAEQLIALKELELELYDWTNPMREPYQAKKIDVQKAEINAAELKSQMKQLVIGMHNSILQLEVAYETQEQAIKIQEEQLRVLKVKHKTGLIPAIQVENAELELAKAKKSLEQIAYQHEILKMAIEKPWAYTAIMPSGSQGH